MNISSDKPMNISKLAKSAQVAVDTVRYYEREGLLPAAARTAAGYRVYNAQSLQRLRFIRRSKSLGFSLHEVANLLKLTDSDGPSASVRDLTLDKLELVNQKIDDLQRMRDALQQLADSCDGEGCIHHCPIIEALND